MKVWTKLNKNKGFTLAEVMVALALVLTVSAIYTALFYSGNAANTRGKQRMDALITGQNIIEQLKASDTIEAGSNIITTGHNTINEVISIEETTDTGVLYDIELRIGTKDVGDVMLATKLYKGNGGSTE